MSWFEALYITRNTLKSVQRGVTTAAGTVTISPVNMNKAFVISVSKGSAGTVAATGTLAAQTLSGSITGTLSGNVTVRNFAASGYIFNSGSPTTTWPTSAYGTRTLSGTAAAAALSGGTTNLTVKEYSAQLTSPTTLSCDGPVEWQVIEFSS